MFLILGNDDETRTDPATRPRSPQMAFYPGLSITILMFPAAGTRCGQARYPIRVCHVTERHLPQATLAQVWTDPSRWPLEAASELQRQW